VDTQPASNDTAIGCLYNPGDSALKGVPFSPSVLGEMVGDVCLKFRIEYGRIFARLSGE
jgi:hypothetical protein